MVSASDQEPGEKFCPRCQLTKLITDFYLATRTNAKEGSPRRRMHWCIECHKKYSAQRRRNLLAVKGQAYRDQENARVRRHMSQQEAIDKRRAAERAKQAAMRELRLRHTKEYGALLNAARQREGLPTRPRVRPEKPAVQERAA
jgi:hypothetical protein